MASIHVKKGKKKTTYYVIYSIEGVRQPWEPMDDYKNTLKRKHEAEHRLGKGTFVKPNRDTVFNLFNDFVSFYDINNWSPNYFATTIGLFMNYINPIIGGDKVQKVTPKRTADFFNEFRKMKRVNIHNRPKLENELVTSSIILDALKLLKTPFIWCILISM